MSLTKKRTNTKEATEARRRNGRRSRGAVTEAGKERAAAANLRHGFYSAGQDGVLRALGEDPDDYHALMESLHDDLQPVGGLEQELVWRLGAAFWRLRRTDRIQQGAALLRVEGAARTAEKIASLRLVPLYQRGDLFKALYGRLYDSPRYRPSMAEIVQFRTSLDSTGAALTPQIQQILCLLVKLANPPDRARLEAAGVTRESFDEADLNTIPEDGYGEDQEEKELESEAGAAGGPSADAASGSVHVHPTPRLRAEKRGEVWRDLLRSLAEELAGIERACHLIDEEAKSCQHSEGRAGLMAPSDSSDVLLHRMEESSVRQLWRLTNLLTKVRSGALGRTAQPTVSGSAPSEAPPCPPVPGDPAHGSDANASGTGPWAAAGASASAGAGGTHPRTVGAPLAARGGNGLIRGGEQSPD
jgi:hypothetical protein